MGTFIVGAIVFALLGLAVRKMVKDRKSGKCGGCSGCQGCSGSGEDKG